MIFRCLEYKREHGVFNQKNCLNIMVDNPIEAIQEFNEVKDVVGVSSLGSDHLYELEHYSTEENETKRHVIDHFYGKSEIKNHLKKLRQ